jgi:hypothetical protein
MNNYGGSATIEPVEFDGFGNRRSLDSNSIEFDGIRTAPGSARLQAGGLPAISRWLSETTPPETRDEMNRIPEGCQP